MNSEVSGQVMFLLQLFANKKKYESEMERLKREQRDEAGKKDKKL